MTETSSGRIQSIDLLRGFAMLLMALDHTREFFHHDSFYYDPTDLSQTTVPVFLTRFITHFCAPVFCFLAGTSVFLLGSKKSVNERSAWLIKRGIWLIVLEFTIVHIGWYFKFSTQFVDLAVIWCLGISMIFLAGIIRLPKTIALSMALLLVFGHNALDAFKPLPDDVMSKLWYVFHLEGEFTMGSITVYSVYPLLPWIGLITLGYYFGGLYRPDFDSRKRVKLLFGTGALLITLFLMFRITNLYGDLYPWAMQKSWSYTLLSILNVTKYPPSLSFICVTIGPALIFLAVAEKIKNKFSGRLIIIGQVPLFFYIIHLYAIHLAAAFAAVVTGYKFSDMILNTWISFNPELKGYGFSLPVVYLIWSGIIIALFPLCRWYNGYKQANKNKWWLSYL